MSRVSFESFGKSTTEILKYGEVASERLDRADKYIKLAAVLSGLVRDLSPKGSATTTQANRLYQDLKTTRVMTGVVATWGFGAKAIKSAGKVFRTIFSPASPKPDQATSFSARLAKVDKLGDDPGKRVLDVTSSVTEFLSDFLTFVGFGGVRPAHIYTKYTDPSVVPEGVKEFGEQFIKVMFLKDILAALSSAARLARAGEVYREVTGERAPSPEEATAFFTILTKECVKLFIKFSSICAKAITLFPSSDIVKKLPTVAKGFFEFCEVILEISQLAEDVSKEIEKEEKEKAKMARLETEVVSKQEEIVSLQAEIMRMKEAEKMKAAE